MPRAVRFAEYGGVEVLDVVEVQRPEPAADQLLLRVRAAGINPFEAKLRTGLMREDIPVSFPAPQGTDVAGVVEQVGADVTEFAPGDEVLGTTGKRGSQAELALASASRLLERPDGLSWEVAGGLWTVATTAYAAVRAVDPGSGDVVVVAGASGGVGGLAAQLARHLGATVIGLAGERSHPWLRSHGIEPLAYAGDGLAGRLRATATGRPLTAMIDTVGSGYVDLAIELGIDADRIDTIADFGAAERVGAHTDGGQAASTVEVVAEVAQLIATGKVELPVAATFPLEQVRDAYALLETGHPPGKIVLIP
jgi:NADPH:quinone reductase-like Zn-dependent oxidoreductase